MYASCTKEQCAKWVHGKDYLLKIHRHLGVFFKKGPKNGPWGTLNIFGRNRESFAALLVSITQYSKQKALR